MPIKAILFDLDDTLIDWSGFKGSWWELEPRHLRHVYQYIHTNVHALNVSSEVFVEEFSRRSRENWELARDSLISPHLGKLLVETAQAVGVPEDRLDHDRFLIEYRWGTAEGVRVFSEVPAVLEKLRSYGLELGIITNSFVPMSLRDIELKTFDLIKYFPRCRWSAADAGYLKPHPEVFKTALKELNVSPKEAIFVGDSLPADIVGAQSSGMRAVWRKPLHSNGFKPDNQVIPDAQIRTLDELLGIVALWS
jgi:putative hydrolase of the HAD superfamily